MSPVCCGHTLIRSAVLWLIRVNSESKAVSRQHHALQVMSCRLQAARQKQLRCIQAEPVRAEARPRMELPHPRWNPPTGKTTTKQTSARPVDERWDAVTRSRRPVTDPRSLMTDDLYVEIVKVLLSPKTRLEELRQQQPILAAQMRRLLLHRHRFQLFWAHVYLVPDTNPTAPAISRLIPILCHVDGKCKVERPEWSQCKRAGPDSLPTSR